MSNENHYVRCLKCKEIIPCSRYDTLALLQHIRIDHPEINLDDSRKHQSTKCPDSDKENVKFCVDAAQAKMPSGVKVQVTTKACGTSPEKVESIDCHLKKDYCEDTDSARSSQIRRLYRTSIEKWKPVSGSIYCPKCGATRRPQIKSRLERYSNNSCCAVCVLSCWPLCFLPFLYLGDDEEYLYCANCSNFLGLYNRDTNCVRPNKDYADPVIVVGGCPMAGPKCSRKM